jgi:hypothetical protein
MRWEVLVMMALLGAVNLIGRWLSAREKAKKRDKAALEDLTKPSERPAEAPRVRVERSSAPAPRSVQPRPAPERRPAAARPKPLTSIPQSPAVPPVVAKVAAAKAGDVRLPGLAGKVAMEAAINRQASRPTRWTAKGIRSAFVAAEILAKPASLRV